jgi:hypothetical protein
MLNLIDRDMNDSVRRFGPCVFDLVIIDKEGRTQLTTNFLDQIGEANEVELKELKKANSFRKFRQNTKPTSAHIATTLRSRSSTEAYHSPTLISHLSNR